jgi:DNA-binding response OmpR family regulator
MKILVIEDEKRLADSIRSMLERKGFQAECVYEEKAAQNMPCWESTIC